MVGFSSKRMPSHILRGRVAVSGPVMKVASTTSSNDVRKQNR